VLALLLGWLGRDHRRLAASSARSGSRARSSKPSRTCATARQDLSIGELFQNACARLGALIVAGLLAGLGIALGFVLLHRSAALPPDDLAPHRPDDRARGQVGRRVVRPQPRARSGARLERLRRDRHHDRRVIVGCIIVTASTFWLPDGVDDFVANVISNTVVVPFVAVAWTIMYFALGRVSRRTAATATRTTRRRRRFRRADGQDV
jgi:hypothetical protein